MWCSGYLTLPAELCAAAHLQLLSYTRREASTGLRIAGRLKALRGLRIPTDDRRFERSSEG